MIAPAPGRPADQVAGVEDRLGLPPEGGVVRRFPIVLVSLVFSFALGSCGLSSLLESTDDPTVDTDANGAADTSPETRPETGPGTRPEAGGDAEPGAETAGDGLLEARPMTVERVVDGDSIEALIDGEPVDVRLIGYNAPELHPPGPTERGQDPTCNGSRAKEALTELLAGGPLTVVGNEEDRFSRLLAEVMVGGRSVGEEMINRGWGLAVGDAPEAREAMKQAAADRRGFWGDGCGTAAVEGLSIGETQVDPAGSDRDNLNDEWVMVVNTTPSTVDLDGWIIRDDTTGHRFELSGSIGADRTITIRTGRGSDGDNDRYLGESFPVWSNRGETVLLVDPAGVVAAWAFID